jgi:hypothetical protein
MRHTPIVLILSSILFTGCGKSDESSGGYAASGDGAESAVVTMDAVLPAQAPVAAPAPSDELHREESGRPRVVLPPGAQVQVGTSDTGVIPPQPGPGEPAVSLNPMLIRTGTATLQVDSLEQGIGQVRALAQRLGGIVGNTAITSGTDETRQASVELRIPSASFDRAVGGLSPIGRVEQVNVTAEDVGEEFTDVTARVANARRLESRLLDLLDRRTGRLEEVLNLERELARVREEIERYEGRLRYLRTRASVSVLTITLHEPRTALGNPGDRPIRDAFRDAWRNFVDMVAGVIAASGILVPLALLLYGLWRAVRWMRRRERDRDAAYREALRRERERTSPPEEPVAR